MKTIANMAIAAAATLAAMSSVAAFAQERGYDRGSAITVYTDAGFSGDFDTFRGDVPNLSGTSLNDLVSSMQVRGDWEVCTDSYYRGRCTRFSVDVRNLANWGLNDQISSLRRVGGGQGGNGGGWQGGNNNGGGWQGGNGGWNNGGGWGGGNGGRSSITVYSDRDFGGRSARFDREIANLRGNPLNDQISSMEMRGSWEACSDAYFQGNCQTFTGSVRNLNYTLINDEISSLRPVRDPY